MQVELVSMMGREPGLARYLGTEKTRNAGRCRLHPTNAVVSSTDLAAQNEGRGRWIELQMQAPFGGEIIRKNCLRAHAESRLLAMKLGCVNNLDCAFGGKKKKKQRELRAYVVGLV